jgi:hypothetical protein
MRIDATQRTSFYGRRPRKGRVRTAPTTAGGAEGEGEEGEEEVVIGGGGTRRRKARRGSQTLQDWRDKGETEPVPGAAYDSGDEGGGKGGGRYAYSAPTGPKACDGCHITSWLTRLDPCVARSGKRPGGARGRAGPEGATCGLDRLGAEVSDEGEWTDEDSDSPSARRKARAKAKAAEAAAAAAEAEASERLREASEQQAAREDRSHSIA